MNQEEEIQNVKSALAQLSSELDELRTSVFAIKAYLALTTRDASAGLDDAKDVVRRLAAPETSELTVDRTAFAALRMIENIQGARPRSGRDPSEGPDYRGIGPRNYQRTDARIAEEVKDRLTDDPHVDASEISVRAENGKVTLDGAVASRRMKRRAEDIADTVSAVGHVQNNLRVQRDKDVAGREMPGAGSRTGQRIREIGDDGEGVFDRRARHAGSSAGGYGTGGAAADYRSVVGPDMQEPDAERVFPPDVFGESGHRGRGPKGYRRTDERILDELAERLTRDPHVDASTVEAHVREGEVALEGTAASKTHKRYIEDLAEDVSGVVHVQNNLRIDPRARTVIGAGGTTGGGAADGGPGIL